MCLIADSKTGFEHRLKWFGVDLAPALHRDFFLRGSLEAKGVRSLTRPDLYNLAGGRKTRKPEKVAPRLWPTTKAVQYYVSRVI